MNQANDTIENIAPTGRDGVVAVPASMLLALLDMAEQHVQDVELGVEDGTYDEDDNQDIAKKRELVNACKKLSGCVLSVEGNEMDQQSNGSLPLSQGNQTTCLPVKHWDAYAIDETVMTHEFEIDDHRNTSGQAFMTIAALGGNIDDLLSVSMEVNTNPANGIDQVPCAHVHFDDDNLAVSLFKIGGNILLRPETGVVLLSAGKGNFMIKSMTEEVPHE